MPPSPLLSRAQLARIERAFSKALSAALRALAEQELLADTEAVDARILCDTAEALLTAFGDGPSSKSGGGAKAAFAPFEALLSKTSVGEDLVDAGDKMSMPVRYFVFGKTKVRCGCLQHWR